MRSSQGRSSLMPVSTVHTPGVPAAAGPRPRDSRSAGSSAAARGRRPAREEGTQPQLCLSLRFCSVINSSGYSLLFKHPVLLKPYLGGVFPQHMLEFTVSAAALQSTFGFSHPQTAVVIRGGFPLLSRGGQAQQLAFCRDPRIAMGELGLREHGGSSRRGAGGAREVPKATVPAPPGLGERVTRAQEGAGVFVGAGGDLAPGLLRAGQRCPPLPSLLQPSAATACHTCAPPQSTVQLPKAL